MLLSKTDKQKQYIMRINRKKAAAKAQKAKEEAEAARIKEEEERAKMEKELKTIKLTQPLRKKKRKELVEEPVLSEIEKYKKMLDDSFSDCFAIEEPSFLSFKQYFGLDENATPKDVAIEYNAFITRNSPEALKKRLKIDSKFSEEDYEKRQELIKKFKSIYTRYLIYNNIFKGSEEAQTKILP